MRNKRRAFTLVELLVVIAIIGILASFLMPALNNAISSARAIECVNNQKQIILGTLLFANEHQDHVPGVGYNSGNGLGQKLSRANPATNSGQPKSILVKLEYVDLAVLRCPESFPFLLNSTADWRYNYGFNKKIAGVIYPQCGPWSQDPYVGAVWDPAAPNPDNAAPRISAHKNPSEIAFSADAYSWCDFLEYIPWLPCTPFHGGGARAVGYSDNGADSKWPIGGNFKTSVSYLDGHAALVWTIDRYANSRYWFYSE